MRVLTSLVFLLAALGAADTGAQTQCRAIDGDTLRCGQERIRLRGIYTPEIGEPGGFAAKDRLQRRLEAGEIRIERNGRDRYGRTLGHVYVNGARITQSDVGRVGGRGQRR